MKLKLFLLLFLFIGMASCSNSGDDPDSASANAIDLYGTWEVQLLGRTYFMAIGSDMNGYTYTITNDQNVPNMMTTHCTYNKDLGTIDIEMSGIPNSISSNVTINSNNWFSLISNGETMSFKRKDIESFSIQGVWYEGLANDIEVIYDDYQDGGIGSTYCIYNNKEEYRYSMKYNLDNKNMILKKTVIYGGSTPDEVFVQHLYNYNPNTKTYFAQSIDGIENWTKVK